MGPRVYFPSGLLPSLFWSAAWDRNATTISSWQRVFIKNSTIIIPRDNLVRQREGKAITLAEPSVHSHALALWPAALLAHTPTCALCALLPLNHVPTELPSILGGHPGVPCTQCARAGQLAEGPQLPGQPGERVCSTAPSLPAPGSAAHAFMLHFRFCAAPASRRPHASAPRFTHPHWSPRFSSHTRRRYPTIPAPSSFSAVGARACCGPTPLSQPGPALLLTSSIERS